MIFQSPPRLTKENGQIRRVGFEIEFGGLKLDEAAKIIQKVCGGQVVKKHHFSYLVRGTRFGDFVVESDSHFLSEKKYEEFFSQIGISPRSAVEENVEKIIETFTSKLLPFEVSMPPLPLDQMVVAEQIRRDMQQHRALGTTISVLSAFGTQLNVELPDLQVTTILSYLRSFFLLYDWLAQQGHIVMARRIAPYIHPFSKGYMKFVLNPSYNPTMEELMKDYLEFNPTRNRPLDLLPLFAYLNQQLVFNYPVERNLVKSRPAFHYRLPNSEIDREDWCLAAEWNKWVQIERLSVERDKIEQLSREYIKGHELNLFAKGPWVERTREWIHDLGQ